MRMRGLWLVVLAPAVLAACPGDHDDDPDGRPDSGLWIRFSSDPGLPSMPAPDRRIDEVSFRADSVRAIGDAAPGDLRTTRMDVRLRWTEGEQPEAFRFEEAPVGLYSSVEVRLRGEGGDHAYEIDGEALVVGVWQPYELSGDELMTIAVPTSTALPAGGNATIALQVDLASLIAGVDFTLCPLVDSRLDCDGQAATVAAAVAVGFAFDDGSAN